MRSTLFQNYEDRRSVKSPRYNLKLWQTLAAQLHRTRIYMYTRAHRLFPFSSPRRISQDTPALGVDRGGRCGPGVSRKKLEVKTSGVVNSVVLRPRNRKLFRHAPQITLRKLKAHTRERERKRDEGKIGAVLFLSRRWKTNANKRPSGNYWPPSFLGGAPCSARYSNSQFIKCDIPQPFHADRKRNRRAFFETRCITGACSFCRGKPRI